MQTSRRILALVTLDGAGEYVARRALQIAGGGNLVLATIVSVDTGCEFDPHPISSPWDIFQEMVEQATQHLQAMAQKMGLTLPIRVEIAQGRTTALSMATSEGVDLIIVGDHATFYLDGSPFWFHLLTGTRRSVEVLVISDATTTGVGGWSRRWKNWCSRRLRPQASET